MRCSSLVWRHQQILRPDRLAGRGSQTRRHARQSPKRRRDVRRERHGHRRFHRHHGNKSRVGRIAEPEGCCRPTPGNPRAPDWCPVGNRRTTIKSAIAPAVIKAICRCWPHRQGPGSLHPLVHLLHKLVDQPLAAVGAVDDATLLIDQKRGERMLEQTILKFRR